LTRNQRAVFLPSGSLVQEIEEFRGWIDTVKGRMGNLDPGLFALLGMAANIMDEMERRQSILFDKVEALELAAMEGENEENE
jgi:hypothetical protein